MISLVLITCCLAAVVVVITNGKQFSNGGILITGALVLLLCAFPSSSILFIYTRYYPDKDIPGNVMIANRIGNGIAWFCALIVLLAAISMLALENEVDYLSAFICALYALLTVVQLIMGTRLIKTIRQNARLNLENSFN
jgi:hypothetical protein